MNTAEFQSQIIDKLDKVVAGAEALMMDERARTLADFDRLKSEIRGLLEVVTAFERLCHGESSLQSVKQTIAALKRTVETERVSGGSADAAVRETVSEVQAAGMDEAADEDDGLSFGFEVLPDAGENAASAATDNGSADEPAEASDGAACEAEKPAGAAVAEKSKSIEPELGLMFDDEPETAPVEPTDGSAVAAPMPTSVEPEPEVEAEPAVEPA
ncbi:MAG: hypothetical protein K2O01_07505, partial [Bacteroidales bacterium]|nr:hypothetical protein [Bacteroidales bacterium]